MKVYALPEHLDYTVDYSNYNHTAVCAHEEVIIAELKHWLIGQGYTGPNTGEISRFGVADGYAQYMFADDGRKSCLIHLPFGDAYSMQYIERLKADILREIDRVKSMEKLFGRR